MKFSTALRQSTRRHLERLGDVDIVVGIPCFNNDSTIAHVIKVVEEGLNLFYSNHRSVVLVADGGSVDDSREVADDVPPTPWVERHIFIYRGLPGKGSAVRAIFEGAELLNAKVCLLFDSDLRSITPEWVRCICDEILNNGYQFIAPYYKRFKYDGTITNNIVYNLTRALYGYQVRQPIGGDFGIHRSLIKTFVHQDVWDSDVARFGIDIWLTTTAMVQEAKIAQANLGVKIHDEKDPSTSLGPMFRQVVYTLLELMEQNEETWKNVKGSSPVPIVGPEINIEPKPFSIDLEKLIHDFKTGYQNYHEIWQKIIEPENWQIIEKLYKKDSRSFRFGVDYWARILYDLAVAFHHWEGNRQLLVNLMTPLYFARVASFVNETYEMTNEEAEAVVEKQAEIFEANKDYLIQRWDKRIAGKTD